MNEDLQNKRKKRTKTSVIVGCFFLGTILALILFEFSFRLIELLPHKRTINDRPAAREMNFDSRMTPQSLVAKLQPKKDKEWRIIALGDSFTFGPEIHVDDTYPARLERILSNIDSVNKFEVYNFGIRGYSTVQELHLLKKFYMNVEPNLVLLQITLNDLELVPYRVTHPYLDEHGKVRLTNSIFKYWHSLKAITERIFNSRTHSLYLDYYSELFNNVTTYDRFKEAIHEIKKLLVNNNVPLFAVIFPLFSHSLDNNYPFIEYHKKIRRLLEDEHIPFIDLIHRFKYMESSRLQVIPGVDSHPNEIAHRIAADVISGWLIRQKSIPISLKSIHENN